MSLFTNWISSSIVCLCEELTYEQCFFMWIRSSAPYCVHPLIFRLIWEETLLDSLLNFAATPKGLLLLQQTGAMKECVSYMFSRFTKKLQVILHFNATQAWRDSLGSCPPPPSCTHTEANTGAALFNRDKSPGGADWLVLISNPFNRWITNHSIISIYWS